MALPAWLAAIIQFPAPAMVSVADEREQGPLVTENATGSPEVAVALIVKSGSP